MTSQWAAEFFFHGSNKAGCPVTSQTERELRLSHETSVYNNSVYRHYLYISSSSSGSDIFRAFNPHPYMLGRLFLKPKIKGPGIICIFQVTAVVQICFGPSTIIEYLYAKKDIIEAKNKYLRHYLHILSNSSGADMFQAFSPHLIPIC